MYRGRAEIIIKNEGARRVVASAARISTTAGSALELFEQPADAQRDLNLVRKVLASGHQSLMEHQTFSIAFDRVSVLVEQFMIEHRLASYIVKSRRYVDFAGAGYFVPEEIKGDARARYAQAMDALFALYADLVAAGIPKEDARFVLPYAFSSNFYVTLNARTLISLICEMRYGRGAEYGEIAVLGGQLETQFETLYPGVIAAERKRHPKSAQKPLPTQFRAGGEARGQASLTAATPDPQAALTRAMAFSGRFEPEDGDYTAERNILALVRDSRPRELEFITAEFAVRNVSLSCITHFARHRMLSLLVPDVAFALARGDYVVPATIRAIPELLARYEQAFANQAEVANALLQSGAKPQDLAYLALSGHVMDLHLAMNGRELLHFLKLRTCNRAQWEIRFVARAMLEQLRAYDDDLFWAFGPSCYAAGYCPEGKLSCGKPAKG
ncbi:MAG: FAD-dependent thymidylate synthase [Christensenellales bacterium]|jgi:flavin-dependent thymidylate synthase